MIKRLVLSLVVAGLIIAGGYLLRHDANIVVQDNGVAEVAAEATPLQPLQLEAGGEELIDLTADEFKDLFNALSLPSTATPIEPPAITGDVVADSIIQDIASKRGYRLQLIARDVTSQVDGVPLQERVRDDWQALVAAAEAAGIELYIRSGYRSVDEQRSLFASELSKRGMGEDLIKQRAADSGLNELLRFVAPPGYSRHHSGYTIDIADRAASVFAYSEGFAWLSKNNYENAKRYGFIPSYPDAENQGPDPEPWEYVWVNRNFVLE